MTNEFSSWPDFDFSHLRNVDRQLQEAMRQLNEALEPIRRMQQEWQRTLAPLVQSQTSLGRMIEELDVLGTSRFRAQLHEFFSASAELRKHFAVLGESAFQRDLDELVTALNRVSTEMREAATHDMEGLEREAAARGLTVSELLKALRESGQVVTDLEKLKQLQQAEAERQFHAREISVIRFLRALPPDRRPSIAKLFGVADSDFEPLISGITRKGS